MGDRRLRRVVWGGPALALVLLAGCTTVRLRPEPAAGVVVDATRTAATLEGAGVTLLVRPSGWSGTPASLPAHVTLFHVVVTNAAPRPLTFAYADLVLLDEAQYQYTALSPQEVEQLLRAALVATGWPLVTPVAVIGPGPFRASRWRYEPFWPWDWWGPWYHPPLPLDDVYRQALPVGTVRPDARVEGFVYFPRLPSRVSRIRFEFHHRLGESPGVLTAPFAVERTGGGRGDRS